MQKPLFYSKAAVETMMRKFDAPVLPPIGRFHYHQGAFLIMCAWAEKYCGDFF